MAAPEQPPTIAAALAELQTQLPRIGKTAEAQYGKYADLAGISRELLPLMGKLGLSFIARPTLNDAGQFVLLWSLMHVSGDHESGEYPLPGMEKGPQALGSAITYARRYILCAVTGAAPDDDDDDGQAAEEAGEQVPRGRPRSLDVPSKQLRAKQTRTRVTGPEHEQLRAGAVEFSPGDGPITRTRTRDAGGPWLDQPAGEFDATTVEPENVPGGADSGQLKAIHTLLSKLGLTDRDKGLTVVEQIIGHPLAGPHRAPDESDRTTKNLSWQDAQLVKKELGKRARDAQPAKEVADAP